MCTFGRVCKHWYSVFKQRLKKLNIHPAMSFRRQLPMLLMPTDDSSEITRNIYSLPEAQVYDIKLPVPYNSRCIGSSHGWLIFIESVSFVITLYNPFYFGNSKGTIRLPPFLVAGNTVEMIKAHRGECEFFLDYYICKAVLSGNPSSGNDFFLMLIYGEMRTLACYNSGNVSWSYMSGFFNHPVFFDIMYHQGNFLAVNYWGEVFICDIGSNNPIVRRLTEAVVGPIGHSTRRYLVQLDDGNTILQVIRLVECSVSGEGHHILETSGFAIYKLEADDDLLEWRPVSSITDGALFVGDNDSTYVDASEFPGIFSNSIYFTDDYHDVHTMFHKPYQFSGHTDNGIFLMNDSSFRRHHIARPEQKHLPPPIWILPTI